MTKSQPRPRTVDPVLAALHGQVLAVHHVERVRDDVLFPNAPAVEMTVTEPPATLVLPARWVMACPGCEGRHDPAALDPLAIDHVDERCEVAAEEEGLRLDDLRRLRPIVARGGDRRHRLVADVERLLLGEYGVRPVPGAFTTVIATPGGDRRRQWSGWHHEPALAPRVN